MKTPCLQTNEMQHYWNENAREVIGGVGKEYH